MQQEKSHSQKKNYVRKQMDELVSGDILLHPIYRSDGLMVINKDTVLDVPLINKIKKACIALRTRSSGYVANGIQ